MHRTGKARCMAISTAPRPIPLIGGLGTHPAPDPRSGECDAQNHAVVSRCARKEAARWQANISAARSYRAGKASATAAAAYRAAERILDRRTGIEHGYSRKQGVVREMVMVPRDAPEPYRDRSELWNAVEEYEPVTDRARENEQIMERNSLVERPSGII